MKLNKDKKMEEKYAIDIADKTLIDEDTRLSLNFKFGELTTTNHTKLLNANRKEALAFIEPLTKTANALQEIRALLNVSMTVSSGYRGDTLNKKVGGSATSSHSKGLAADVIPDGMVVVDAFNIIFKNKAKLKTVRKVIYEAIGGKVWLHIQAKSDLKEPLEFYKTSDGKNYTPVK